MEGQLINVKRILLLQSLGHMVVVRRMTGGPMGMGLQGWLAPTRGCGMTSRPLVSLQEVICSAQLVGTRGAS